MKTGLEVVTSLATLLSYTRRLVIALAAAIALPAMAETLEISDAVGSPALNTTLAESAAHTDSAITAAFTPAQFRTGPDSMVDSIACPNTGGGERNVVIYCQVAVDKTGRIGVGRNRCLTSSDDQKPYVLAVHLAADKARLKPATLNNEPVKVQLGFRAVFRHSAKHCDVALVPNLGYQQETLGIAYVAPQPILQGRQARRMSDAIKAVYNADSAITGKNPLLLSALITPEGNSQGSRIDGELPNNTRVSRLARSAVERIEFIPGFINGKPVSMRHYNALFNRGVVAEEYLAMY